jgi:hypothetical protein
MQVEDSSPLKHNTRDTVRDSILVTRKPSSPTTIIDDLYLWYRRVVFGDTLTFEDFKNFDPQYPQQQYYYAEIPQQQLQQLLLQQQQPGSLFELQQSPLSPNGLNSPNPNQVESQSVFRTPYQIQHEHHQQQQQQQQQQHQQHQQLSNRFGPFG